MFRRISFIVQEKKSDLLILKVILKNLYCYFRSKIQNSLILDYRSVGEVVWWLRGGGGGGRGEWGGGVGRGSEKGLNV